MHRYLNNYEDFLLVDDDCIARISSQIALGPRSRPRHKRWESGDDDAFDSDYDEYEDDYDGDAEEDFGHDDDRFDRG